MKAHGLFATLGAFLVPVFEFLYGEGEVVALVMFLIVLLISGDWIAGSRASKVDASYASEYGFQGLWRTAFILLLPSIGHLIDRIFVLPGVVFGLFSFGIVYHVLNSMTANAVRAGWGKWVPSKAIGWVSSEIEHKVARSMQRKQERNDSLKGEDN